MLGRAGRPGFDSHGVAVMYAPICFVHTVPGQGSKGNIVLNERSVCLSVSVYEPRWVCSMTSAQDREFYSDVSLSADVVESTLLEILPEGM